MSWYCICGVLNSHNNTYCFNCGAHKNKIMLTRVEHIRINLGGKIK